MKRTAQRLMLALVICMFVLSFSAQGQSSSNAVIVNRTGYPIVKQPITLNFLAQASGTGDNLDWNNMTYFKELEKLTNIKINFQVVKETDWVQKLNLMMASGQYPDAIYNGDFKGSSISQEERYGVQQKILAPLDGYLRTRMPRYSELLKSRPLHKKVETATDGKMYAFPGCWEMGYSSESHLFINKKWLDKLGLKVPTDIYEFEQVLQAFKTKDPNGNGKADEIPLALCFNNFNNVTSPNIFFSSFGRPEVLNHFVFENKKVVFTADKPQYKEALAWLSGLYKQGLMDLDTFTIDGNTYNAKIKLGNVGVFAGWRLINMAFSYPGMENDYICLAPLKGPTGRKPVLPQNIQGIDLGRFSMTKANKYPEATMRWVDTVMQEEWSVQCKFGMLGNTLFKDEKTGKYYDNLKRPDGTTWTNVEIGKQAPIASGLFFLTSDWIKNKYTLAPYLAEKIPYCDLYRPYLEKEPYIVANYLRYSEADQDTYTRMKTDIHSYVTENVVKFIINGFSDKDWENYTKQMKTLGLTDFLSLVQKAYTKFNRP